MPILVYHRIIPAPLPASNGIFVEVKRFRQQMNLLASLSFKTVSLDMIVSCQLPKKPIVITFDDGYQDNYLYAFPILKEYDFTATIFLVSCYIGKNSQWDTGKEANLLSINEIKEMAEYGISFGSHTVTHPHLTQLSKERASVEITQSKKELEGIVEKEITSFCYPYGEFSYEIKEMVSNAGYKCGCACDAEEPDLFSLTRVQVFPETNLFGFWRKIQGWYPWYKRLKRAKPARKKKILVLRNDRIGDLILSLPAVSALRKGYPDAHIAVLVQPFAQDILYKNEDLDEIILDEGQNIFELIVEIRKKGFDLAVVLYPSWRNGWLCALSRIPIRVGTGFKPVGLLFNQRVYVHRRECHERDWCLHIAEKACQNTEDRIQKTEKKEISLWIKEEDRLYAKHKLKNLAGSPIIGIHPGSLGSALNWPESHYARLIELLKGRNVVITGTKKEEALITRILARAKANPLNLSGKTSLSQLIALFSLYDLFIGPSTGPMHIASALGKPVIALFSPIKPQSPVKWGPLGEVHAVLMPEVKCGYRKCSPSCKLYNCMDHITPEQVLETIERQLYRE